MLPTILNSFEAGAHQLIRTLNEQLLKFKLGEFNV